MATDNETLLEVLKDAILEVLEEEIENKLKKTKDKNLNEEKDYSWVVTAKLKVTNASTRMDALTQVRDFLEEAKMVVPGNVVSDIAIVSVENTEDNSSNIKETSATPGDPAITVPQPIFQPGTEGMKTQPAKNAATVVEAIMRKKLGLSK